MLYFGYRESLLPIYSDQFDNVTGQWVQGINGGGGGGGGNEQLGFGEFLSSLLHFAMDNFILYIRMRLKNEDEIYLK